MKLVVAKKFPILFDVFDVSKHKKKETIFLVTSFMDEPHHLANESSTKLGHNIFKRGKNFCGNRIL